MKKIALFIALLSFGFTLFSCSSDDDNSKTKFSNDQKILGKWSLVKKVALDAYGKEISSVVAPCPFIVTEFNSDKTFIETDNCNNEPEETLGTWEINNNILIINQVEEDIEKDITFEIINLNNDVLKIERSISEFIAGDYPPNAIKLKSIYKKIR